MCVLKAWPTSWMHLLPHKTFAKQICIFKSALFTSMFACLRSLCLRCICRCCVSFQPLIVMSDVMWCARRLSRYSLVKTFLHGSTCGHRVSSVVSFSVSRILSVIRTPCSSAEEVSVLRKIVWALFSSHLNTSADIRHGSVHWYDNLTYLIH